MIRNYNLLTECLTDAISSVGMYERVSKAPANGSIADIRASFEEFMQDVGNVKNDLEFYSMRASIHDNLFENVDDIDELEDNFAGDFGMDEKLAESGAAGTILLAMLDEALDGMSVNDPAYVELNRERAAVNAIMYAYNCCEAENEVKNISDTVHAELEATHTDLDTYDELERGGQSFMMFMSNPDDDEYTDGERALFDRLISLEAYSEAAAAYDMKTEYGSLEAEIELKRKQLAGDPDVTALTGKFQFIQEYSMKDLSRMLDGKGFADGFNMSSEDYRFVQSHKEGIQKIMDLRLAEQKKIALAKSQPDAYKSMMRERADAVATASDNGIREQFAAMSKQLGAMRKFGLNSADFRKFCDALNAAAKGGDLNALADAAGEYVNKKTKNGKISPTSESGRSRLELARQVARLARAAVNQKSKMNAQFSVLTEGLEKQETSSVNRIEEAKKEAADAEARMSKMCKGNGPLSPEEQAEAAELFLRSASNKLTQHALSLPGTNSLAVQLSHNPKLADQYIGNERAALNDAFFSSNEPLTREGLRRLMELKPEELTLCINRAIEQKNYLAVEQNKAIRVMTAPGSTPEELKDAAASLLACHAVLNKFDVRRDQKEAVADAKQKLSENPAFASLTADPAALRARFAAGDPKTNINRLVKDFSETKARQESAQKNTSKVISNPSKGPAIIDELQ